MTSYYVIYLFTVKDKTTFHLCTLVFVEILIIDSIPLFLKKSLKIYILFIYLVEEKKKDRSKDNLLKSSLSFNHEILRTEPGHQA